MNIIKKNIPFFLLFIIALIVTVTLTTTLIPKARTIKKEADVSNTSEKRKEILRISAVGDSLTEGIGDSTLSGGYVPLLQRDLNETLPIDVVQADNYGKSGDRSDQIVKRLKKDDEMRKSVEKADVILLTVGGNDLMKVIQTKMFNKLSLKTFEKPRDKYETQLDNLFEEIRTLNKKAPIYQLGIYNPFYKNFSEIEEMQEIVDFWNEGSRQAVTKQENAFFVPINDEIYNGLPNGEAIGNDETSTSSVNSILSDTEVINNLLSEEDSFHPNNLGYQIVANAFKIKMLSTKDIWLEE